MKISWVKYKEDKNSLQIPQNLGMNVLEIEDLEQTDEVLKNLIKQNYQTIIVSNEVAAFSEDMIKKYAFSENVTILISPVQKRNTK